MLELGKLIVVGFVWCLIVYVAVYCRREDDEP